MAVLLLGSKLNFKETSLFVENINQLLTPNGNPKVKNSAENASLENEIIVDMKDCQYLNSIMLSGLIRALNKCKENNKKLILRNVNTSTSTLFETTNVIDLFTIEKNSEVSNQESSIDFSFKAFNESISVLSLSGVLLTAEHCAQFRTFYESKISAVSNVVLDCSKLHELGSAGVTEMFRLRGLLSESNGKLAIIIGTDSVESIWKMMHLESLIPNVSDMAEAQKLLSAPFNEDLLF